MSHLSIHPIDYLRHHLHLEEPWTKVLPPLRSFLAWVLEASEQVATITVVLVTAGIVVFSCLRIGQSALTAASYDAVITELVLPPLQGYPTSIYPFSFSRVA